MVITSALLILLSPEKMARVTFPSFTFTATGDYGSTQYTINNVRYIGTSIANGGGAPFYLGLGGFNYDTTVSADTWYNAYVGPYPPPLSPLR